MGTGKKAKGKAGVSGKRQASVDVGEDEPPAPKRLRSSGCCEACRKRPQQAAWAQSDHDGHPLGERCAECVRVWELAFMYLSWSEFTELFRTEVGHGSRG